MAYNANIPQSTDQLSVSQGDLLNNFTSLGNVLNGVDNLACLFPLLSSAPVTGANVIGLYNSNNGLTFVPQNAGTPINFTTYSNNLTTLYSAGWTTLPSGLILAWNNISVGSFTAGVNTATLSWTSGAPTFSTGVFFASLQQDTLSTSSPVDPNVTTTLITYTPGSAQLKWYASARYPGASTSGYFLGVFLIGI